MKHKLLILLALALGLASNTRAEDVTISSAAELVAFASRVNAGETSLNATLTTNIDLDGTTWTPIGNSTTVYTGTFDGGGFTISNFSLTTTSDNAGLFGKAGDGAVIKDFTIEGSITSHHQYVGVIGTTSNSITISGIHSKVDITCEKSRHGGVVGYQYGTGTINIDHCAFSGSITVNNNVTGNFGGIVALTQNSASAIVNISNCLFDGTIDDGTGDNAGGIVGYSNKTKVTIKNCLSKGTITATNPGQFIGQLNASNSKWDGVNYYVTTGSIIGEPGSGVTMSGTAPAQATSTQLTSGELCYLLNTNGTNWFQTIGTDNNPVPFSTSKRVYKTLTDTYINIDGPVQIGDADDLVNFAAMVNNGGTDLDAELTANINLSEATWTPIGNSSKKYSGTFDGGGYAISNFNYTATAQYAGLFGYITTATIKNFSISGTLSSAYNYTGMIGYATAAKVSGIHSSLNVTATANTWVGGIVAGANGAIEIAECTYDGTLNTSNGNAVGGIMGYANTGSIRNCIFSGTLEGGGAAHFGGILGYVANAGFGGVENCLSTGTIDTSEGTFSNYAFLIGNINTNTKLTFIKNNYFEQRDNTCPGYAGAIANQAEVPIPVSSNQLESGEVCYLLNGDQSTITFYQTIGTDAYPTLDSSHGHVYRNGVFCRDTNFPQGTYFYGNNNESSTADHSFTEGFCSYCGYPDEDYISVNGEGYYEIATPTQFKWFAAYVNYIDPTVNAKLTANINLNNVTWTPIGNDSNKYTGTFDGCGYTISNLTTEPCVYNGLFGYINGATVKDFNINGNIETLTSGTTNYIGVIGMSEKISHISGIHSSLNITVRCESDAGGVLGSGGSVSSEDKLFIDCCSFSGTLTIADGVAKDQFGGIVGYTASATITNCLFNGTLSGSASNRGFGGILGYTNVYIGGVQNCLSIGNISGTGGRYGTIIGNYNSTTDRKDRVKNNYYLSGSIAGAGNNPDKIEATGISAEQLASGEVAYKLGAAWYQTIGTDTNPVLDSSREKVLYVGAAGYSTFYDADKDWALSSYNGDAKAFIGTLTPSGGALHLEEIGDIPASTAVVIGGTYYNKVSTTATADATGNILIGSTGYTVPADKEIFALSIADNIVGFYPVAAGVIIPAGKAYLDLTDTAVKEFLTFVFDDATGINEELRMKNEESSEVIYNVAGQRLGKMQKGINIVNGKKIMVK